MRKIVLSLLVFATTIGIPINIQAQQHEPIDFIGYLRRFDFADPNIKTSTEQEQYLVDYFFLLQHQEDGPYKQGLIQTLVHTASHYPDALDFVLDQSHRYLTIPESPVYDPTLWQYFRQDLPGRTVLDFAYIDEEERDSSLYKTPLDANVTLFFYNPDCEHCMKAIAEYKVQEGKATEEKNEKVWAINVGDDKTLWKKSLSLLPKTWKKVMDQSHLLTRRWYDLETLPHIVKITPKYLVRE